MTRTGSVPSGMSIVVSNEISASLKSGIWFTGGKVISLRSFRRERGLPP